MNPKISNIAYYVAPDSMGVEELIQGADNDKVPTAFESKGAYTTFLQQDLNMHTIRVEKNMSDEDMLLTAVEEILNESGIDPASINVIILAQEAERRQQDNLGQFIQHELDIDNAYVLNICGNHCSNVDHALLLVKQLMKGDENLENVLIMGSVNIEDHNERIIGTYGLLSDGAAAMLITRNGGGPELIEAVSFSKGSFHNVDLNKDESLLHCKYYVHCIDALLEKSGLKPDDIKQVITQNANTLLISQCLDALGINPAKIFQDNLRRYGHLDCLDIMINLKDLTEQSELESGSHVLTFGTGWAGSYIASIIRLN
jgi:3-oxoacyl-[acyl-carrier-protein] synthase-3